MYYLLLEVNNTPKQKKEISMKIDFELLRENYPNFHEEWGILEQWQKDLKHKKSSTMKEFTQEVPIVKENYCILFAIGAMIKQNMLSRTYQVISPSGNILPKHYDNIEDLPDFASGYDFTTTYNWE